MAINPPQLPLLTYCRTLGSSSLELRRSYYGDWHELVAKDMVYVYWAEEFPRPESSVRMLSDAIVMMRATNPTNLNLPFMLEDYYHKLSDDKFADVHEMYLRNVPLPAATDNYLAADQLLDEMLGSLRQHFAEDSPQIVSQKCNGMAFKLRLNRNAEAEDFYEACKQNEHLFVKDSAKARVRGQLEAFRRIAGKVN